MADRNNISKPRDQGPSSTLSTVSLPAVNRESLQEVVANERVVVASRMSPDRDPQQATAAVVKIESIGASGSFSSSGVIVHSQRFGSGWTDYYVLTAKHNLSMADQKASSFESLKLDYLQIQTQSGKAFQASRAYGDPKRDLALLRFSVPPGSPKLDQLAVSPSHATPDAIIAVNGKTDELKAEGAVFVSGSPRSEWYLGQNIVQASPVYRLNPQLNSGIVDVADAVGATGKVSGSTIPTEKGSSGGGLIAFWQGRDLLAGIHIATVGKRTPGGPDYGTIAVYVPVTDGEVFDMQNRLDNRAAGTVEF